MYCHELQLNARYCYYLAEYLRSGFAVRQIGNTYNTFANGMEQLMTLSILVIGAWTARTVGDLAQLILSHYSCWICFDFDVGLRAVR